LYVIIITIKLIIYKILGDNMLSKRFIKILLLSILVLVLVFVISLSIGSTYIPPGKIINILFNRNEVNETYKLIINKIRLPRIILSFLVGSSLGIAGVVFQGIIRNPMVDPYIVGISSGAGTGVTLAIVLNLSWSFLWLDTIPLMAFIGAIITVFLVYSLSRINNKTPMMTFLLAGVAMGFILNAIMSFLMVMGAQDLHKIIFWLMGSFASGGWYEIKIMLPYYIIGLIPIIFFLNDMNIILLGEENAHYLGIDVEKVKKILITSATLITAAGVSVSGNIGFIGLVIPHITRMLVGPDHRKLLPMAGLFGGIFLLISDDLARFLLSPLELPVGIITSLAGGPYFIYLLRNSKKQVW